MTKRPPEMVELHRHALLSGIGLVELSNGHWTASEPALAAIRSLRVKLFRERAARHNTLGVALKMQNRDDNKAMKSFKRAWRFVSIADAIERGER